MVVMDAVGGAGWSYSWWTGARRVCWDKQQHQPPLCHLQLYHASYQQRSKLYIVVVVWVPFVVVCNSPDHNDLQKSGLVYSTLVSGVKAYLLWERDGQFLHFVQQISAIYTNKTHLKEHMRNYRLNVYQVPSLCVVGSAIHWVPKSAFY